jgi:hypothetical protein
MQDANNNGVKASRNEDERQQGFSGEGCEQINEDLHVASASS